MTLEPGLSASQNTAGVSPLGVRVAAAAAWMVLLRIGTRLVGLISTVVIVRLLSPEDFGIVAMAGVTAGMLDMLSGSSFELALVRATAPDRREFDTVWTFNVLRGAAISLFTVIVAPFASEVLQEPRIEILMYILAIVPALKGLENIKLVEWQRNLSFKKFLWISGTAKIFGFLLVLPAAVVISNYWALVIGQLGSAVISLLLGYLLLPYRPQMTLGSWRPLFDFSKWLVAGNLLTVIESYSTTFIISRMFGAIGVGLYQISAEIGHLPASEVAAPIRIPMYAGYSKVAQETAALKAQVLNGFGIVVMLLAPLSIGLGSIAEYVAGFCLGPKWAGSAPLIAICAMAAFFENLWFFTYHLYLVRDAQARFAKIRAALQILRIAFIIYGGVNYGLLGAAGAICVGSLVAAVCFFNGILPLIQTSWGELGRVTWRSLTAALCMMLIVRGVALAWPPLDNTLYVGLQTVVLCLTGAAVHILLQGAFWWVSSSPAESPEAHALKWARASWSMPKWVQTS